MSEEEDLRQQWIKHLATVLWDEVFPDHKWGYIVVYNDGEYEVEVLDPPEHDECQH